jgi:murein DD-endopeptidase MepM/ murein hydrolase activator NlpD
MNFFLKIFRRSRFKRDLLALLICLLATLTPIGHGPCLARGRSRHCSTVYAQTSGPHYTVQPGDTLFEIARRFGVTLEALLAVNPGLAPDALAVGQQLVIPGFEGLTGALATHTLEPGESLDSLSLRFGLARETLVKLNRLVNPERLYVNEAVIIVEGASERIAAPTGETIAAPTGLVALAALHNQNPWALAVTNAAQYPGALPPGSVVVIPGGEHATTALPWPIRAMQFSALPPVQGHTISIRTDTAQSVNITGVLGDWPLHFNVDPANPNAQYALLGIYRLAESNLYPLTLSAADESGNAVRFSQAVPVREGDYGADPPLTVDPATIDPAVTAPETEQIKALVSAYTPTRYWAGPFALPSVGVIRSYFGSLRSYNGGPYDSFHSGVDFTGGDDRPITAPAPGVVVFTGALTVRGNATVIDHGWGVFTGYWHQSAIQVQTGQAVNTGDIIGFNGATGRVTGPHLHWELWVGGFQVDPLEWTETVFP